MLPVANRPLVEYVMDTLEKSGVRKIFVILGYGANRIQDHFGNSYEGLDIIFLKQLNQLGSGHALLQAADHVGDEFLVVNGDNIIDPLVIENTVHRFRTGSGIASAAIAESNTPEEYGVVLTNGDYIEEVIEHPNEATNYRINAGVYMLTDAIFDALHRTERRNGELYLTDALVNLPGDVLVADTGGVWLDPSYPWDLLSVTESMLSKHTEQIASPDAFDDGILISDSARLHDSVIIEPPVIIGAECEIDAGTVIRGGACLGHHTSVGPNSVIDRTITGVHTDIGSGVLLNDCVFGEGVIIGDGVVAPGGVTDIPVNDRIHRNRKLGGVVADRSSIGANATIRPGALVGANASIGPGVTVAGAVDEGAEVIS